jgi:TRAP-type C4-dicarboxylate transport system permease large subunit
MILWTIIVTYILLGALMDELAMILLTVPIFFPLWRLWATTLSGSG